MGIPVLIIGESGSGKTSSLRNFKAGEVGLICVAKKRLPFRANFQGINIPKEKDLKTDESLKRIGVANAYDYIKYVLDRAQTKTLVIDDSQYLMTFDLFSRAKEKSYDKFTEIGLAFYNLIQFILNDLPDDKIVYLLHHTETTDAGMVKAKTVGKMLDNQLVLEGLFSIVLMCRTDGKSHNFVTITDGLSTVKSPIEMLPPLMDNDLKEVDRKIREYWFPETQSQQQQQQQTQPQQQQQQTPQVKQQNAA